MLKCQPVSFATVAAITREFPSITDLSFSGTERMGIGDGGGEPEEDGADCQSSAAAAANGSDAQFAYGSLQAGPGLLVTSVFGARWHSFPIVESIEQATR